MAPVGREIYAMSWREHTGYEGVWMDRSLKELPSFLNLSSKHSSIIPTHFLNNTPPRRCAPISSLPMTPPALWSAAMRSGVLGCVTKPEGLLEIRPDVQDEISRTDKL